MKPFEFLKSILAGGRVETVAEIEAALAGLDADETAARAELAAIAGRRETLLLAFDDDKLDADDRAAERQHRLLERLAAGRTRLQAQLAERRGAAHRDAVERHRKAAASLYSEMREAIARLVEMNGTAALLFEAAERDLGATAEQHVPRLRFGLPASALAMDDWRRAVEPVLAPRAAPAAVPATPKPKPAAVTVAKAEPAKPKRPPVKIRFLDRPAFVMPGSRVFGAPGEERTVEADLAERLINGGSAERVEDAKPRAAPIRSAKIKPGADGRVAVQFLRGGIDLSGLDVTAERVAGGDVLRLLPADAERVVLSGAGDYAGSEEAAA